jgi:hypothetical protein
MPIAVKAGYIIFQNISANLAANWLLANALPIVPLHPVLAEKVNFSAKNYFT